MDRFSEDIKGRVSAAYDDREQCQNCRELSDELLYSSSWGFLGCPSCVIEARAEEAMRAQEAAECVACASTKKAVSSDREIRSGAVCCEQKQAFTLAYGADFRFWRVYPDGRREAA